MKGPRVNKRIRANEVQLITHEGDNIGVVPIGEALDRAREVGLDLIEVAPNVKPPVCKIIDYGKYKYEIQKKASQAKKKQKIITFDINSKRKIILVSFKKNLPISDAENLGAKCYEIFKKNKKTEYRINTNTLHFKSKNIIGHFLHGIKLKSYKFLIQL